MAKLNTIKHSSTESVTIYIDGRCLRCDQAIADHPPVCLSEREWQESRRFEALRGHRTLEEIVSAIRKQRAATVLGGAS